MQDKLFDKVYGALIGAAIGDAMGGPVECYTFEKIHDQHGWVDRFLPYEDGYVLSCHGAWSKVPGTYTDDSRTAKFYARTICEKGAPLQDGDLLMALGKAYHQSKDPMEREHLEDYYYKAVYGSRKLIFGGQPANAAIMGMSPFGAMHPCDPQTAHDEAFELMFMTEGYARYSAAMAASAVAAAMTDGISPMGVIECMLRSVLVQKASVDGDVFARGGFYKEFCIKNEAMVREAVALASSVQDVKAIQLPLRNLVQQQFFADAAETLSTACAMFVAADGNFQRAVEGCVNFGRDNDSSASVAGAIAGAYRGASAIPSDWIERIESVNPAPTFRDLAGQMCAIIRSRHALQSTILRDQAKLISP